MKKVALLLVIVALSAMVIGCPSKPAVEPDTTPSDTPTDMPDRGTEVGQDDDQGLMNDRGQITDLAELGFARIHFDTDKWNIREDAREILKKNAALLEANSDLNILIEGHCDERNTEEYNLALGERRASATKDYLVKLGIDGSRISTISYGEERPIAFGSNESSWQQNRRAEFKASE